MIETNYQEIVEEHLNILIKIFENFIEKPTFFKVLLEFNDITIKLSEFLCDKFLKDESKDTYINFFNSLLKLTSDKIQTVIIEWFTKNEI